MDGSGDISTTIVSLVIPTKNRAGLLVETLRSVQEQTHQGWEAIVVDDGSTDDTQELVRQIVRHERRIVWLPRQGSPAGTPAGTPTGAAAGRNLGVQRARGTYVVFLDSDDLLAPEALRERVAVMEASPHLDFAVFPCELFERTPGDQGILWNVDTDETDLDRWLKMDVPWQTTGPIWRRMALQRLGPWNESLPSWQDWELHIRAVALGLRYARHGDRPDCFWRVPGRRSIGRDSASEPHLRSHERLLGEVASLLRKTGTWNETRRHLLAGLHFWLAETWAQQGRTDEAVRVWGVAGQRALLEEALAARGSGYFRMWAVESLRRTCRAQFERTWPAGTVFRPSATFRQVAVGCGRPAVSPRC